jgi:hypothetical protein
LAIGLAQDGMTRVTVVVPRQAGVLQQAREAASTAGVDVTAENLGTASITLRFSPSVSVEDEQSTSVGGSLWARLLTRFAAN